MNKEQKLYDKFLEKLLNILDKEDVTDKELKVIQEFLKSNNIQASPDKNPELKDLINKFDLPFEVEEMQIER